MKYPKLRSIYDAFLRHNDNWSLGLVLVLILLFFVYDYNEIIFLQPQSVHLWRQSDCASQIWNFYDKTANLFTPQIHNQIMGNGKAAGEFPITYWFSGMLYRVLGPHIWIARMVHVLIVFSGLWAFSRTIQRILKDRFWAAAIPILLFSSPVFVFYTCNFLPEPPAMGCIFWGWYFFFKYREEQTFSSFLWSVAFFSLGTLIKVSTGISFVAVAGIFIIEWNRWQTFGEANQPIFKGNMWKKAAAFLGGVLLIGAWYVYANTYSIQNQSYYFLNVIKPITDISQNDFYFIFYQVFAIHLENAFMPFLHLLNLFLMVYTFRRKGRSYRLLFSINLLMFLGTLTYILLWFWNFNIHDYYITITLLYPAWLFVHAAQVFKEEFSHVNVSWVFQFLVTLVVAYSVHYTDFEIHKRYHRVEYHTRENLNFYDSGFKEYLTEVGVTQDKKVISLIDISPNNTLYLMNRKGWSSYNVLRYPDDVNFYKERGAEYLIIGTPHLLEDPSLQEFYGNEVGVFGDIHIYKL